MPKYQVWSEDHGEDAADALEINESCPEEAAREWCDITDGNGGFTDGFPDGDIVRVHDTETGETFSVSVTTDFEPVYYCHTAHPHTEGR